MRFIVIHDMRYSVDYGVKKKQKKTIFRFQFRQSKRHIRQNRFKNSSLE